MRIATDEKAIKWMVERGMADQIANEFERRQGVVDSLTQEIEHLREENGRLHSLFANSEQEIERLKTVSTIDQRTIANLKQTPEWEQIARLTADYRKLESELANLRRAAAGVELAFQVLDNGLHPTPEWVKQQKMREAVNHLRLVAKEVQS